MEIFQSEIALTSASSLTREKSLVKMLKISLLVFIDSLGGEVGHSESSRNLVLEIAEERII